MCVVTILVMRPRCSEQTLVSPTHGGSTQKLSLFCQAVSAEKKFEYKSHIHVYSLWVRADNHLGSNCNRKHKSLVNLIMCCKFFFPLNDHLTVLTVCTTFVTEGEVAGVKLV